MLAVTLADGVHFHRRHPRDSTSVTRRKPLTNAFSEALPERVGHQRAKREHLAEVAPSGSERPPEHVHIRRAAELQQVRPPVATWRTSIKIRTVCALAKRMTNLREKKN